MFFFFKEGPYEAVKIANFSESQPLSTHLFYILCDKVEMLIKHLCAYWGTMVVSTKSVCGIVWITSWTSHSSFLLEIMTEAWWGCRADRDQMLEGLVATLIRLGDLTSACLFHLFILSCSHKYSPSLLLALSKAHTSLPALSFLWSFLPPGDVLTALKSQNRGRRWAWLQTFSLWKSCYPSPVWGLLWITTLPASLWASDCQLSL